MQAHLDTRVWNIVVGVGMAVGCSARRPSQGDGDTGASDEGTNTSADTQETSTECTVSSECPDYYECVAGMCEFHGDADDGVMPYGCLVDTDCGVFGSYAICQEGYCVVLEPPPPGCLGPEVGNFTIPAAGVLRLSFVDLDDDGHDELAVATQDQLQVFEDLAGPPSATARDPSNSITAMAAGHFDVDPGEDVVLLIGDQLYAFSSNGVDGFVPAAPTPAPMSAPLGLLAGDFDAVPPTDLLVWGDVARMVLGSGAQFDFLRYPMVPVVDVLGVAAFDLGSPPGHVALRNADNLLIHDLNGTLLSVELDFDGSPKEIVSLSSGGDMRFVTWTQRNGWSHVQYRLATGELEAQTYIIGMPFTAASADVDGDGDGDLVYLDNNLRITIHFNPVAGPTCWLEDQLAGAPAAAAVGDLDGDGDDEVALQMVDGSVVVVTMI